VLNLELYVCRNKMTFISLYLHHWCVASDSYQSKNAGFLALIPSSSTSLEIVHSGHFYIMDINKYYKSG
jgi:hypothetical protein